MKRDNDSMSELTKKVCIACKGGEPPLTEAEAKPYLEQVNDWNTIENSVKIEKRFEFKNFVEAMSFINKVADLAEQEGHHPDIFVSYNKVKIQIYTHKIGGLHENDFILAAKIDQL